MAERSDRQRVEKVQWTFSLRRGSYSSRVHHVVASFMACDFFTKSRYAIPLLLLVSKKVTFAFATSLQARTLNAKMFKTNFALNVLVYKDKANYNIKKTGGPFSTSFSIPMPLMLIHKRSFLTRFIEKLQSGLCAGTFDQPHIA